MQTLELGNSKNLRSINSTLQSASSGSFKITRPEGLHAISVGLSSQIDVEIDGHVGYYCAGMNQKASVRINGNAGQGLAENIMSGTVRVTGNASAAAGATGCGGMIVIEGNASSRCGISMKGVNIVVAGSVGHMSAFMAQAGSLVICGDAGAYLGDSIYETIVYVAGKVESLGADCIQKDMTDAHIAKLRELIEMAGINADPTTFKRYGSGRTLYSFDVDNVQDY